MAKKDDKVHRIIRAHHHAIEQYRERLEMIRRANSFFIGDQWDDAVRAQRVADHRPVLTINMILPLVMQLLGNQAQRPRSWRVHPVADRGDDNVAALLQELLFFIANSNDLNYIDQQVFTGGIVGGAGWWTIDTSFDDDPLGEIKVDYDINTQCFPDVDARRYDQKDWKHFVKTAWMSYDDLVNHYGKRKLNFTLSEEEANWQNFQLRLPSDLRNEADKDLINVENGNYKVIEFWERKAERGEVLFNPLSGEVIPIGKKLSNKGEIVDQLRRSGWEIAKGGLVHSMDVTTVFPHGDTILEEKTLDYYYYPFFGFFPMLFSGITIRDAFSYIENLISPQEEKNKMRSYIQDVLQKQAYGGAIFPAGESELAQDYQEHGAEPGWTGVRKTNTRNSIEFLSPDYPTGVDRLMQVNDSDLQRASAQSLASSSETAAADESGVLFQSKLAQTSVTLSPIFQAFERSRSILAKGILERIQKDYTEERVFRIIGAPNEQDQLAVINQKDAVDRVLNDVTVGEYDVHISEEAFAQNSRESELRQMAEMIKVLPPEAQLIIMPEIIRNSSLKNRHETADKLEQVPPPVQENAKVQ